MNAEDARWLLETADPGDWSSAALEALAAERGWTDGYRVTQATRIDPRFTDDFPTRELAVTAEAGHTTQNAAEAFRRVRDELVAALGEADSLGSHGVTGPWFAPIPSWGAPFLRWRRPDDRLLELRATKNGAELVLQQPALYEGWRTYAHEGTDPGDIGGFVHERISPHNEGLETPGASRVKTWKQWERLIPDFLEPLPAETLALGTNLHLYFFAGASSRLRLISNPDGELYLRAALREPAPEGWYRTEDRYESWRFDGGTPGTVDGARLAAMMVTILRAQNVRTLRDLFINRGSEHQVYFGLYLG